MTESTPLIEPNDAGRIDTRREYAKALAQEGYQQVHVLSLADAGTVLTDRRIELIETLRQKEYQSVRALARDLDRDQGAVSRDLSTLAEHGITTLERDGNAKRPVLREGTVVVEPLFVNRE
ncbi:transcriptional regulator [Salinirubellus sp. GCM10025818]|uniref:HVO_A0114 family putative DNA-binding protein n=1 Tax=Salinirubellus TaxID=2162630 RepID=UPI0030D47939